MLHRIATGETPRLHSIDQTIPEDLDAICATAMAKHRENRYETAKELKAALLEFRIHEESIHLTKTANKGLANAMLSGSHALFQRAIFGFESALDQWPDNSYASTGLKVATYSYAELAFESGDYDLALSLLDETEPDYAELREDIQRAADELDSGRRNITAAIDRGDFEEALSLLNRVDSENALLRRTIRQADADRVSVGCRLHWF